MTEVLNLPPFQTQASIDKLNDALESWRLGYNKRNPAGASLFRPDHLLFNGGRFLPTLQCAESMAGKDVNQPEMSTLKYPSKSLGYL
ncbi:hypothetical protein [Paraburkholderia sp. MM5477-R1]|uniref:hypothetical protein n=1 Tax=Paraburkholderia sp. MM5477-R1 TaxID=2991062 RepID=UPI003D1DCD20